MSGVAEVLQDVMVNFPARAGETGKLYGSVTTRMISEAIQAETGVEVDTRSIDSQPIRSLGLHTVNVRLTMDLVPQIQVLVYREGESPAIALEAIAVAEAEAEAEGLDLEAEALLETDALEETDDGAGEALELLEEVEVAEEPEMADEAEAAEAPEMAEEAEAVEAPEMAEEAEAVEEAIEELSEAPDSAVEAEIEPEAPPAEEETAEEAEPEDG
jgi:hypothetical protein